MLEHLKKFSDSPQGGGRLAPEPDDLLEPLALVVRGYLRDFGEASAKHDLPSAQARALLTVREPVPMNMLAGRLACDVSNITGLIARLEARGLVERRASPDDRRIKLVVVTAEGAVVAQRIRQDMKGTRAVLAALAPERRTALLSLLRELGGALGE